MAALLYHQLLSSLAPLPAQAHVEPLTRITRQIHKPNMLVVMDTSGSLTGVPGGTFDYADEVGVDCDNGFMCRGGVSVGTCAIGGKSCANDSQCASSTCQDGRQPCVTAGDCQPIAGFCATGQECYADADCPAPGTGRCAADTKSCSPTKRCTPRFLCKYGNSISCSTNNDCKTGVCANNTTACFTSNDCPYATDGGTCAYGTTPEGGCANAAQCPARAKVCSDNPSLACTTVNDCGGTCKRSGSACTTNAQCTQVNNDYCDFSGKTCSEPANSCILPRMACNTVYADNTCQDTNTCVPDPNPCTGAGPNQCLGGISGDLCNASGTVSGSRMCRITQYKCTSDSDCKASGDSCGPASSRMVIAKRAIRNVVANNANVVNLGLMTFFQAGYFPYFVVGGSPTTTTEAVDLKSGTLEANGCYSKKIGLQATCTVDGKTYNLKAHNNAKYLIKGHGSEDMYVDADYCGWFCDIPGVGTGVFKGGYYDGTEVNGTLGAQVNFPTYRGKSFTENGVTYRYYDSRPDYYNGGAAPPIQVVNCGNTCSASCGARWDTQLAPFLTTDDSQANIQAVITAFDQALEPANNGGLIAYGGNPAGCALENDGAPDRNHSAYHYIQDVKSADPLTCRQNFVLLITDGEANGPGDDQCSSNACAAADPQAAGCHCRAVLSAWHLRQNLGVKTFVVGFSTDGTTGNGRLTNNNIAKAGGTDAANDGAAPYAYIATSESELTGAIQDAIYNAVQGSYSTSPATASQGTTQGTVEQSGNYLLDARVDFPSWKGHLVAYDLTSGSPTLAWDAATKLAASDWKTRRVYTSDSRDNVIKIDVDQSTGAIRNRSQLYALGLGSSDDEAERIARWMLGDPTLRNPAVLGSIINSTPIDVGAPADGTSPGLHSFYLASQNRPSVTYVGSDDGMLHAFYTKDVVINGTSYVGGNEAYAYMPKSMLRVATRLYAQGGQLPDPRQHIYGLASSPKVKSICTDNCTTDAAVWKTVLVMTEGWGGNGLFMLDVTDPTASTPFGLLWSSANDQQASTYNGDLGYTASVPAFTFVPNTAMNDFRVIFSSGYPTVDGSTTQGRYLMSSAVMDGTIKTANPITAPNSCPIDYTLLTDVGTARRQSKDSNGTAVGRKEFLSGYYGDTWGNLWMYTSSAGPRPIMAMGCNHPLHFSPTVVQPDADDPNNPNAGDIYLVQVTNSSLDTDTERYPASQMVVLKQRFGITGDPSIDTSFATNGKLVLTSANTSQLCGVTNASGTSCLTPLPANARPLATPTAILKADGTGFITFSNWYAPADANCGKGATYMMIHDMSGSTFTLKQALKVADEPVVNPIIVKGNLVVSTATGPMNIASSVTIKIISATEPRKNLGDPFQMSGWTEVQ
jgi:PilY1 beta-propeller domain